MISRQCQKNLLTLLNDFIAAESKLEEIQEILWKNMQTPSSYIKLFMASIKPRSFKKAWHMTQNDLKTLLDEMHVEYGYEELLTLTRQISSSRTEFITFKDWLFFVFSKKKYSSLQDFNKLARYLSEAYEDLLAKLAKNRLNAKQYKSSSYTVEDEVTEVQFDKNFDNDRPWRVPNFGTLDQETANSYRHVFTQELANMRKVKLASEMVSFDSTYSRKRIFKLFDTDNKGYFTFKELKQYTFKMGQPMYDTTLRLLYQRMRQEANTQVASSDFMYYLFDVFEEGTKHMQKAYNFYYEKIDPSYRPRSARKSFALPSNGRFR